MHLTQNCFLIKDSNHFRSLLYLKLFLITEFLYVFDFISFLYGTNTFLYVIKCVINLQGVFIFNLMILRRYHVRKILGEKNVLCLAPIDKQRMISEDDSDVELVQLGCKISDV